MAASPGQADVAPAQAPEAQQTAAREQLAPTPKSAFAAMTQPAAREVKASMPAPEGLSQLSADAAQLVDEAASTLDRLEKQRKLDHAVDINAITEMSVHTKAKRDNSKTGKEADRLILRARALDLQAEKFHQMAAQAELMSATPDEARTKRADMEHQEAKARDEATLARREAEFLNRQQPVQDVDDRSNDCPLSQQPTVGRLAGRSWLRPAVANDFLVLEYNADPESRQTRWYDYRDVSVTGGKVNWNTPYQVNRNGTFLPVVWSKEKILVHVCGLRFTDIVTVSNDSTGLPEGGADIRGGATVSPVPTLTPAVDSIQAVGATGQALAIGGLGFGATTAFTTASVTGYANGTVSRAPGGVTYGDSAISSSPEELALLMYETVRNGMQLSKSIQERFLLQKNPYLTVRFQTAAPDTFNHIALEAYAELSNVYQDATDPNRESSASAFDKDMTDVQNLSTEMTNFFGALSSQGYGTRAVTVWSNYAELRGPLDLIWEHARKKNCIQLTEAQVTQAAADAAAQKDVDAMIAEQVSANKLKKTPVGSADYAKLKSDHDAKLKALSAADAALSQAQAAAIEKADSKTPSGQPVNCDDWETQNNIDFLRAYRKEYSRLAARDPATRDAAMTWHPVAMFKDLQMLGQEIDDLTKAVGGIYSIMNLWSAMPEAEQTDFITPVAGNALGRISISVQHGYVPFMLASYGSSTAPTVTTPAAPTITTAASTSTPSHTVKTVLVEVHRRANLNLIGGAMFFRVPNTTYAVQAGLTPATVANANPTPVPVTTSSGGVVSSYSYTFVFNGMCNGVMGQAGTVVVNQSSDTVTPAVPAAPGYTCVIPTQTGNTQIAGMVGVDWFPLGRDYFPLRNGAGFSRRNLIPALYAATSVTSLGNSSFGFNVEPFTGVDFQIGAGMAHSTVLPAGVTPSTVLPTGYTLPSVTQVNWGWTFGFGFDLNVFSQIFTKGPSSATLP